jgi:death on curing protein
MTELEWLTTPVVTAIHDEQLAIHGGSGGIRDSGLLESALARPQKKWAYEQSELSELAAAYAYGLAKNHPFVDGNKRTSLLAIYTFLGINGVDFIVPEA